MRNVAQQAALSVEERFEAFSHAIKCAPQFGDSIVPLAADFSAARGEIACCQPSRRRAQLPQRHSQISRQPITAQTSRQQYHQNLKREPSGRAEHRSETLVTGAKNRRCKKSVRAGITLHGNNNIEIPSALEIGDVGELATVISDFGRH